MSAELPSGLATGIPHQCYEDYGMDLDDILDALKPPWFYTWKYDQLQYDNFIPMIWKMDMDWVARALPTIQANRERLWIAGNEPDLDTQSNTSPQDFAEAYKELKRQTHDTTLAAPGILWDRYMYGKQWLDEYIAVGGLIPDVWHVHLYVYSAWEWGNTCPEMLSYLRSIADIPIIISECASWHPTTVVEVLEAIQETVRNGDVQAACYFSAYYKPWQEPSLLTEDGKLTEAGEKYIEEEYRILLPIITS